MNRKHVVLELMPDRIDVVVEQGSRRLNAKRLDLPDTEGDALEWAKAIRRSGSRLCAVVEEFQAVGAPTTVIYRSPTQAVDLANFGVRSPAQAMEAAVLSCMDSLSYSTMSAVCEATAIGRDGGGEKPQTHVVVAAEREDIAESIVELVNDAGLLIVSATPRSGAVLAHLAALALDARSGRTGRLYVGEHTSYFVVSKNGMLLFSRRIDLGMEAIINSLTRPFHRPGGGDPITLKLDDARRMLHRHGIPGRDDVVDEEMGLTGAQIIPLMQPVLQRYIVELRQSLRFGVSEEDRLDLAISLTGPGASVPGLAELITAELGLPTVADEDYKQYDHDQPGSKDSELLDALRERRRLKRLNLLPGELARRRGATRLRRWLWTGGAAALAVIAAEGVRHHARLHTAREQAHIFESQIVGLEALQATGQRLRVVMDAKNALSRSIQKEVGSRVVYHPCLQELSRLTPETIRFESITFLRQPDRTTASIGGFAFAEVEGSERTALEAFIENLRSSPLFDAVELRTVNVGAIGGHSGESFMASFEPVLLPLDATEEAHVASADGDAPK